METKSCHARRTAASLAHRGAARYGMNSSLGATWNIKMKLAMDSMAITTLKRQGPGHAASGLRRQSRTQTHRCQCRSQRCPNDCHAPWIFFTRLRDGISGFLGRISCCALLQRRNALPNRNGSNRTISLFAIEPNGIFLGGFVKGPARFSTKTASVLPMVGMRIPFAPTSLNFQQQSNLSLEKHVMPLPVSRSRVAVRGADGTPLGF
jgi:hypothetical protein